MPHRLVPPALSITLGPIRNVRATKHDLASRNVAAAVLAEQRSRPVKGDNPPLFTYSDVDTFAWAFLRSTYAGPIYADWSLDLRLDTFSRRQGFSHVADSGDLSNIVLDRIMAYGRILPRDWQDMANGSPAGAHPVH